MGFKVGFSNIVITPRLNIPMGGYSARIGKSSGIHDDLFARAVYFNYDNHESLLISADILSFSLEAVKFYRKLIFKNVGIEEERIFFCALHNHSGPDTMGLISRLSGFIRKNLDIKYLLNLGEKFVKIAQDAKSTSQEALVGVDRQLMEKRLVINRREPMRNSKFNVGIIRFDDLQGNIIGCIVNYACHGTVLPSDNTLYTAEYPGYVIKRITARLGKKVGVIYLNGPCGDINPNLFDFNTDLVEIAKKKELLYDGPGHAKGNFTRAREIGYAIADKALDISKEVDCLPVSDFKHRNKSFLLPMEDLIFSNSLKTRLRHLDFKLKLAGFKLFWRVNKPLIPYPFDFVKRNGKFYQEAEIQAIKLNDTVIIGIPGEVFSELGERILNKSKFKNSFVVELANGSVGYLFPLEDFKKGGYEVFLSFNPIGGTYLTNKAINLMNSL